MYILYITSYTVHGKIVSEGYCMKIKPLGNSKYEVTFAYLKLLINLALTHSPFLFPYNKMPLNYYFIPCFSINKCPFFMGNIKLPQMVTWSSKLMLKCELKFGIWE